jgi:chemotaxis protein histidine kinase CheA
MSFQDRASSETSALMTRVLAAWSEQSQRELQALRRALDAAADATGKALAAAAEGDIGTLVTPLVEELTAAARVQAEAAAAEVADEARTKAEEARNKIEILRSELEAKMGEHARLAADLEELRGTAHSARAELSRQIEETSKVSAELTRVEAAYVSAEAGRNEAQAALQAARVDAEKQLESVQARAAARLKETENAARVRLEEAQKQATAAVQEKKALEQQLKSLEEDLELTRMESADVTKQLETEAAERAKLAAMLGRSQTQMERAQAALKEQLQHVGSNEAKLREELALAEARLREELAEARQSAEQAAASLASLRAEQEVGAREQTVRLTAQPLDRLLNAFQRLEQSRSVRDVLAAVVDGLASEFARVAVFEVNNNHLEILRQLGFDSDRDMSKVAIPLGIESLLTDAVTTGRIQSLAGPELADNNRPLFGGSPSFILVLPIAVGDEVLAVVYADDSDASRIGPSFPQNHVKFAQLLLWHAVPRLPRLIREERERAEVHEYAVHLARQIQDSYDADVKSGRAGEDLAKRLAENVKCARQMFEGRAGDLEGAEAYFDERLTAVLEEARTTPFGKDLAAATGRKAARDSRKARHVS